MTSIGRVVIVGPASPAALAAHLSDRDRERGAAIKGLGGVPVNALVAALLRQQIEVELVTLTPEVTGLHHLSGPGLDMRIGPYRSRPRHRARDFFAQERRALSELLAMTSGDLVHAHWTYEFALPCGAERRPVLVTAHDAPLTILRHARTKYHLVRTALAYRVRLGTRTLSAVSPYLADRWRREMGYRRPIHVVPNIAVGLPLAKRNTSPARQVILDVSDHGRLKNVSTLIRAFAEVRRQCPDAILRLVGPGLGPGDELARWSSANGLAASIEFIGPVDHATIADHLAAAAVFAHASVEESYGMSVCEAMHAGLPVLGGRYSGGVPWTLDGGRCGILVDVRNPRAIAGGILRFLSDQGLARNLGTAAQHRAVTAFSADAVVSGYLNAYAAAIRERAGAWPADDHVAGRAREDSQ
jgi:glycosyltransferase involved in cell wall biosynthesis